MLPISSKKVTEWICKDNLCNQICNELKNLKKPDKVKLYIYSLEIENGLYKKEIGYKILIIENST